MAWTQGFRTALVDGTLGRVGFRFVVESVRISTEPYKGDLRLSSWPIGGYKELIASGPAIASSGGELSLPGLSNGQGSWTIPIKGGNAALVMLFDSVTRGMIVQVRAGPATWDVDALEPILLGRIHNVRKSGARYLLECRSLLSALGSRLATPMSAAEREEMLFFAHPGTNTLNANYIAGDATLGVATPANFLRETGGTGLVRVTKTAGGTFLAKFTGTGASTLTGVTAGVHGGGADGNAASGNLIEKVAYVVGHPSVVVAKLLASTGNGTNGAYDTLPAAWGFGITSSLLAISDMQYFALVTKPSSGSSNWVLAEPNKQGNPLSWLESWLAGGGFFLAEVQGQISCRALTYIGSSDLTLYPTPESTTITEADVEEIEEYEAWDSQRSTEALNMVVADGDVTPGTTAFRETNYPDTLPAVSYLAATSEYTATASGVRTGENASAWRTDISERLGLWHQRVPERLVLMCAGLRLAAMGKGEVVLLDLPRLILRDGNPSSVSSSMFYGGPRRALVVGVAPDWFGARTRVTLLIPPTQSRDFLY